MDSDQLLPTPHKRLKSSKTLIVWPHGILGEVVVYPIGQSDIETEAIRSLLERALSRAE